MARGTGTRGGTGGGRVGTPGHLAGVPATRAGMRTELGTTPGRFGVSARRKLVPGRLDSGLRAAHGPPLLRVAPARVASQGQQPQLPADEEVGEGSCPQGWGRGLEARAESAAASTPRGRGTRSDGARRGRKLSDLVGKHHNKRPSSAGARPPRRSPASTCPRQPAPLPHTRRPRRGRAAEIRRPDATTGPAPLAPPPPQLTLPAPAAIVTLTETYPVHRRGNAHPSRALLPLCRAVVRASRDRRRGRHAGQGQKRGQASFS